MPGKDYVSSIREFWGVRSGCNDDAATRVEKFLGIGGYCLPNDGRLGYWVYKHILGFEDGDSIFKITPSAIDINDTRGLHVAELARDALRNMGRYIGQADVLVCGVSFRQDVGDTRCSGSEIVVRKLTELGAELRMHDPYVEHWSWRSGSRLTDMRDVVFCFPVRRM